MVLEYHGTRVLEYVHVYHGTRVLVPWYQWYVHVYVRTRVPKMVHTSVHVESVNLVQKSSLDKSNVDTSIHGKIDCPRHLL